MCALEKQYNMLIWPELLIEAIYIYLSISRKTFFQFWYF